MHKLCLPIIKAKRPVWDTFPGVWYTIGIYVYQTAELYKLRPVIIIETNGLKLLI